ncbi:glutamate-rich WD repeat-containing protein 1 [Babesia caballi]|uniref:Glutamate-rich WD repeat-containing protein 1 n=1 Tax=Babesia caballi TaxID=5871 RepID=A0AAV4LZ83_BABCB|nr:glutamate-rich WD repeat-containing protein 1 [Babesia caballi]
MSLRDTGHLHVAGTGTSGLRALSLAQLLDRVPRIPETGNAVAVRHEQVARCAPDLAYVQRRRNVAAVDEDGHVVGHVAARQLSAAEGFLAFDVENPDAVVVAAGEAEAVSHRNGEYWAAVQRQSANDVEVGGVLVEAEELRVPVILGDNERLGLPHVFDPADLVVENLMQDLGAAVRNVVFCQRSTRARQAFPAAARSPRNSSPLRRALIETKSPRNVLYHSVKRKLLLRCTEQRREERSIVYAVSSRMCRLPDADEGGDSSPVHVSSKVHHRGHPQLDACSFYISSVAEMTDEDMSGSMDASDDVELVDEGTETVDEVNSSTKTAPLVWTKDIRPLREDEVLEVAPGCYDMLHRISVDWPCLSFDILADELGACRVTFPHECYVIAGTQPDEKSKKDAAVHVMKWSNLSNNEAMDDSEDESDDESGCVLRCSSLRHPGIVNRIRCCPQSNRLVSTMADTGKVHIWDIGAQRARLDKDAAEHRIEKGTPIYTCDVHTEEGYAVAWSPMVTGALATGDCAGAIVLWNPEEAAWRHVKYCKAPQSIEDIQWSPKDAHIFASACCDGYVRIHDTRVQKDPVNCILVCEGTITDVNTIAWNPNQTNLLATGDETGAGTVYDLRFCESHVAKLSWHKEAITSVAWHPTDPAVCMLSSRDDSVSLWDLSVESESPPEQSQTEQNIPQQLMFLHMGQTEITEVMFHRQIPGVAVSTSADGFNVFKCINID